MTVDVGSFFRGTMLTEGHIIAMGNCSLGAKVLYAFLEQHTRSRNITPDFEYLSESLGLSENAIEELFIELEEHEFISTLENGDIFLNGISEYDWSSGG